MIDLTTIFIVTSLISAMMGIIHVTSSMSLGKGYGNQRLGLCFLCLFGGFLLNGLRGSLPPLLSAGFGSILWVVGIGMMAQVINFLRSRPRSLVRFYCAVAFSCVIMLALLVMEYPFHVRTSFFSVSLGSVFAYNAWLLLRHPSPGERYACAVTAAGMLLGAFALATRAGLYTFDSDYQGVELLDKSPVLSAVTLAFSMAVLILSYGFLLMYWSVAEKRIWRIATTDELTGVMNRKAFISSADDEIRRCRAGHIPINVAMFDLDHFKRINDTYGHAVGDLALKHAVSVISQNIRRSDLVGRFGGEEFILLLPGLDEASAAAVVERILASIRTSPLAIPSGETLHITSSAGLAHSDMRDASTLVLEHLSKKADVALYDAKTSGRDCLKIWFDFTLSGRQRVIH